VLVVRLAHPGVKWNVPRREDSAGPPAHNVAWLASASCSCSFEGFGACRRHVTTVEREVGREDFTYIGSAMTVGAKAILIQVCIWGVFVACGICAVASPSQFWLAGTLFLSSGVMLGTWLTTLNCPRCGHNVASRPIKWLHDFPIVLSGDVFHRSCRWCGFDLRGAREMTHPDRPHHG
jgi:hypothetical protein